MKQLNLEASDALTNQIDQNSLCDDDSHIWGEDDAPTDEHSSDSLILNREWERRHSQFHTMGYRDGITAGKEASAQEGFNDGFKQSVYAGYSWGLVRGISSVMATFPDHLKEKLIKDPQNKERLQKLYASTQAISSNNALQIFHSNIQQNGNISSSEIGNLSKELISVLRDSTEIKVDVDQIRKLII
ncbi:hypothetical protein HPP92_010478 [Vanilla planifolia]|uniref:Essential protein Yae1 N-terminal domain-containing protein n=1 Tax=Vanilla planifolia TaxID=51239 RepID=A0A835V0V6_VANPL|nr:hypothetical protein HPP92_010478 [Vanilla planifolia]